MTHELSTQVAPRPAEAPAQAQAKAAIWPGILITGVGVGVAMAAHWLVGAVGTLTWAVLLGVLVANTGIFPQVAKPGVKFATRRLLRAGIVLLGLSLPVAAVIGLGLPVIGLVVVTLVATLLGTTWLGIKLGLGRPRSLLIGTGFAICGASAIAGMEENAEASEEDVAVAIAMVTLFGTLAMIALPLLQMPLGLTDEQLGAWAGSGVHEVGQVVAAASPAGAAAVSIAVVVKLTRVLMLAPVVASVSVLRRRRLGHDGGSTSQVKAPPIVPVFVLAFLAMVAVRSTGLVPKVGLDLAAQLQTVALGAALFGLGTGVRIKSLFSGSSRVLLLSTVSTLLVGGLSLGGVLLLV